MLKAVFKNRYTLLAVVLGVYLTALVVEGTITEREATVLEIDNSLFELVIPDFGRLTEDSPGQRREESASPDEPVEPAPAAEPSPAQSPSPVTPAPAASPADQTPDQAPDPQTPGRRS